MTISGKSRAILTCLQLCAGFLCYAGGHIGVRLTEKLYGPRVLPPVTVAMCYRLALWPMLVTILWFVIVLARAKQEAPLLEMAIWISLAIAFCLFVGGAGLIASICSLFVV